MADAERAAWAQRIDAVLPQTQCTRCGEPDCASYAAAIAEGAPINRCPPGGAQGIFRLAELTGRPPVALDPQYGVEGPRQLAWIDEAACIGCTLCIKACPVDCIVGAAKRMHTVIDSLCTGCELCLPACPVDCIHLDVVTKGRSGWAAWSQAQADSARELHLQRGRRLADTAAARQRSLAAAAPPVAADTDTSTDTGSDAAVDPGQARQAAIEAALARARARRAVDH